MVVIRGEKKVLTGSFGRSFIERIRDFSEVIGYTIEDDDNEVKVEFNPDRPDLFSFTALHNAMKCYYDRAYWIYRKRQKSSISFSISEGVRHLRKYAVTFIALGKPISGNLQNLIDYQERIHDNLGKNRSKVSIGIHDLAKLEPPFEYVALKSRDIRFKTYDGLVTGTAAEILQKHPKGTEYAGLIPSVEEVPVILDSSGDVLSMPPVVNGIKSKVEEGSGEFFVDVTGDDRKAVRDAYLLLTYEFENLGYEIRTVDFSNVELKELEISAYDGRRIRLNRDEQHRITGLSLSQDNTIEYLRKMGYMAEPSSEWVEVRVPGNRIDVMGEVDIIEDVAKAYGIPRVKEKKMDLPLIGISNESNDFASLVRDALIGAGLQEVRSFVVSSSKFYENFRYEGGLHVLNPKSLEYSMVRDRLYINLLDFLRINKRRPLPHRIFEIGEVYRKGKQETRICAMIMDTKATYSSIKQVIDYLALRLGIHSVQMREGREEGFIEGRTGRIFFEGSPAGIIGEIAPDALSFFDLGVPAVAFEITLYSLMKLKSAHLKE